MGGDRRDDGPLPLSGNAWGAPGASGRVTARRRRIYDVAGEVLGADGRLVAEGKGRYLGATPSEKAELRERYGVAPGVGGE